LLNKTIFFFICTSALDEHRLESFGQAAKHWHFPDCSFGCEAGTDGRNQLVEDFEPAKMIADDG